MQLNLQPLKLNGKLKAESIKTAKYIHVGNERIPIGNIRLEEIAKAYFQARREEITQKKIDEFIKDF